MLTITPSIGVTPHYVVFGRHARLPVDFMHGVCPPQRRGGLEDWVDQHHRTLLGAYERVKENAARQQARDQKRYNRLSRDIPLLPGERVLLRNFHRRAHGKLAPRWIPTPFVVVSQLKPNQPVYVVKPEGKGGAINTLHRNNIRACGLLLQPDAVTQDPEQPQPIPQSPASAPGFPLNPRPVTLGQPTWFGLLPGPATTLRGQRHMSCGPTVTGFQPANTNPHSAGTAERNPPCSNQLGPCLNTDTEMGAPVDPERVEPLNRDNLGVATDLPAGNAPLRRSQRSNFGVPPKRYQ